MRLKGWYDESTKTITFFEDDGIYVFLVLLVIVAAFMEAIITFVLYLAISLVIAHFAKKADTIEEQLKTLSVGSAAVGIFYSNSILYCILFGQNSAAYIVMLQLLSIGTAIYAVSRTVKGVKLARKMTYPSEEIRTRTLSECEKFKKISILTLVCLLTFFSGLYIFNVPFPEEIREAKEQAELEEQIAQSVSVWDLEIIESEAIYGDNAQYDSYGNLYTGEYREFCAWNYSSNRNEPYVIVDVNEKYDYTRFTGTIFTRPSQDEELAIVFRIYADDKCIYDSGEMHASTKAIELDLDITGVDKLKFMAFSEDNDSTNPAVILENAMVHAV